MLDQMKVNHEVLSPCGVDCSVCYLHLKSEHPCMGCIGEDDNKPNHCKNCAIARCAEVRNVTHCYTCTDFPCKRIEDSQMALKASHKLKEGAC